MDDHFWQETYYVWAPVTDHYEYIHLTEKTLRATAQRSSFVCEPLRQAVLYCQEKIILYS